DTIAAGLICALREQVPDAVFEGIAGPRMQAAGCHSLFPMERLSVMGLTEVLVHLPGLLAIRRALRRHFTAAPPDLFIGVDAPDFNLGLEHALKRAGLRTLHYVSPSVWAWRRYRVRKIAASVDCMLTLFPFEARFYHEQQVPARFVGHPLADQIADDIDRGAARDELGIPRAARVVALLPGSRVSEVGRLAQPFLEAAAWCQARQSGLVFVVPLASDGCRAVFEQALGNLPAPLPVTLLAGRGLEAMAAADAVLLASGTATLECMLLKRPMVVAYRLSAVTYRLARWLVRTPFFSLPNLLAGQPLVAELIQDEVNAENLGREVLQLLDDPMRAGRLSHAFAGLHADLRRDASRSAAEAVLKLIATGYCHGD
ncbi:MAG: lipid-A-disaccharide synthase, partial [Gammaproteobacteria bacterium]